MMRGFRRVLEGIEMFTVTMIMSRRMKGIRAPRCLLIGNALIRRGQKALRWDEDIWDIKMTNFCVQQKGLNFEYKAWGGPLDMCTPGCSRGQIVRPR